LGLLDPVLWDQYSQLDLLYQCLWDQLVLSRRLDQLDLGQLDQ